jgi:hypothetical protein
MVLAPNGLDVIEGMTKEQVLGRLGEPNEKIEMEASRKARWLYDKGEVTFYDGRAINNKPEQQPEQYKKASEPTSTNSSAKKSGKALIGDILKNLPASNEQAPPPPPPLLSVPGEE